LAADFRRHPLRWLLPLLLLCGAALGGCGAAPEPLQLAGSSMGTGWHVTVVPAPGAPSAEELQQGIQARLDEVEQSMSTYRADSEISRFNAAPVGEWFPVSEGFFTVLTTALAVGWQSEGAYDVTVGPLVEAWGFGASEPTQLPPDEAELSRLRARVGQDNLQLDGEGHRILKRIDLALDLSSIAKGYAVDQVALWLSSQGVASYLVEVGGEMRLAGQSPRDDLWRVAIEQPESSGRAVGEAIRVTDAAVATSGDYRNFFEVGGVRYSHSIDPRSGHPVTHDLVSVTVVDPSAMIADAWATALIVLGAEEGMAVAQRQGLAVYFMQRDGQSFKHSRSPAFEPFLESAVQK